MMPTECTCASLRQASRFVSRLYDEALAPAGLGINQYSILTRLGRLGPLKLRDLAEALVMDRSTLGHLIRPLEARGYVSIASSCADARCREASLTRAGVAALGAARPLWAAAQAAFDRRFGTSDAEHLRRVLAAVTALAVDTGLAPEPLHPDPA